MSNHVDQSILLTTKASRHLETLLKNEFGAEGTGLHSYTSSVEHQLPFAIVKKLRWIASVRNKVKHEHGAVVDDLKGYEAAYLECVDILEAQVRKRNAEKARVRRQSERMREARQSPSTQLPGSGDVRTGAISGSAVIQFVAAGIVLTLLGILYLDPAGSGPGSDAGLPSEVEGALRPATSVTDRGEYDGAALSGPEGEAEPAEAESVAAEPEPIQAISSANDEDDVDIKEAPETPELVRVVDEVQAVQDPEMESRSSWSPRISEGVQSRPVSSVNQAGSGSDPSRDGGSEVLKLPEGALLASAERSDQEYQNALHEIQRFVWDYFRDNLEVKVGEPEMRPHENGSYDLLVPLTWQIEPQPVMSVLNRYFHDRSGRPLRAEKVDFRDHMGRNKSLGVKVRRYSNNGDQQKTPFSRDLFQHLVSTSMRIVVSAGSREGAITIGGGRRCSVSCRGAGDDQFHLHFSNRDDPKAIIFRGMQGEQNPVIIANLRQADVERIDAIRARVVID